MAASKSPISVDSGDDSNEALKQKEKLEVSTLDDEPILKKLHCKLMVPHVKRTQGASRDGSNHLGLVTVTTRGELFEKFDGYISKGGDLLVEKMSLQEAKAKALTLQGCLGLCFRDDDAATPEVHFKDKWDNHAGGKASWTSLRIADADLVVTRSMDEGKMVELRVPTAHICHMNARSDGRVVTLKLRREMNCAALLPDSQPGGEALAINNFALAPRLGEDRALLATLQRWLAHAPIRVVERREGRQSSYDGLVARLEGTELAVRDMRLLSSKKCLNDSVLNFFLRLVLHLLLPEELRDRIHVASSYFYDKLTSAGARSGEAGWKQVERWTRSLPGGLLSHRYIVVPVNDLNIHWWLALVAHPARALVHQKSGNPCKEPRIVCLDSAKEPLPHGDAVDMLTGFLKQEHVERHPGSSNPRAQSGIFREIVADVPKQKNRYDCGVFCIEYLSYLLRTPTELASIGLWPERKWFAQRDITHRRARLRDAAEELLFAAARCSTPDVARLLAADLKLKEKVRKLLLDPAPAQEHRPSQQEGDSRLAHSHEQARQTCTRSPLRKKRRC